MTTTTTRARSTTGIERLRAAGFETPRLDAELLLAYAIGVDRTAVVAHAEAPVGPGAEAAFRASLDRRAAGEPVAYIRGIKEFHGIALAVDRARAHPATRDGARSSTSRSPRSCAARPRGPARASRTPLRVVDVGTGSGAIAVALAVALRARRVPADEVAIVAVDVSPDALDLARENAVGHGGRRPAVGSSAADLLPPARRRAMGRRRREPARTSGRTRWPALPAPTTFEPALALDGGPDGLAVIERLLDRLPAALAADGAALARDRRGPGRGDRRARRRAPARLAVRGRAGPGGPAAHGRAAPGVGMRLAGRRSPNSRSG